MRYRYAVLAYVAGSLDEVPFAVVCTALSSNTEAGAIFVREGWVTKVSETHREYIEEMLREWIMRIKDSSDPMFSQLDELSTGPLRTLETGQCDEPDLMVLPGSFLGPTFVRLA